MVVGTRRAKTQASSRRVGRSRRDQARSLLLRLALALLRRHARALLFTENETNNQRLFNTRIHSPYVKDGINDYVVHGVKTAVNPDGYGTKAAAHYRFDQWRPARP